MNLPELQSLLTREQPEVVANFCYHHKEMSEAEAKELFKDLLAWLWLHEYRSQKQAKTYLFGPLLPLDAMWHVFILHTRTYHQVCQHYFQHYIHHDIEPPDNPHELSPDELADFLQDCFDWLGEDWVRRYFHDQLGTAANEHTADKSN